MANKEKYIKKQKDNKRLEAIRTFMSSFSLTAIVVFAFALTIPNSPIAKIESIKTFENEIVYQIIVTDQDQALDLTTLKVVLDGQLEYYSNSLELGLNVGVFENLRTNTSYQLEVFGSKGFGDEKLSSMRVVTKTSSNGAIVSYKLIQELDFFLNYEISIQISNPENKFKEVNLYYTYLFPDEEPQFYETIPITDLKQVVELMDVPNEHTKVHLYLEAKLDNDDLLILDELTFYVPFKLATYLYLDQKTSSNLQYTFYEDYYFTDVIYKAQLYYGYMLIEEKVILKDHTDLYHSSMKFNFSNLTKNTNYKVLIIANYQDPNTLHNIVSTIHEEEVSTLKDYYINYEITKYDTYSEVYINLIDPNHYFQVPYYIIYEIIDGQFIYYEENMFDFTPNNDQKFVTFSINDPNLTNYQIIIGVRNQNDYTINHVIIDQIINN
jgi:hypothetical protein